MYGTLPLPVCQFSKAGALLPARGSRTRLYRMPLQRILAG